MNKNVTFSKNNMIYSVENYLNNNLKVEEVDLPPSIPSVSVNLPKLYTYAELKNDEDLKKDIISNELKIIQCKIEECNNFLREIYISVYILLSLDYIGIIHLHGVYTTLDNGTDAFNKIINKDNKMKKLILYKTFVNNLGGDYDLKLFDDSNEDKIYEKTF